VFRAFALPALLLAITPFHSSVAPLSKAQQTRLKAGGYWHKGCPVGLSDLRLLTVTHRNFRGRAATGEIVLNKAAARPVGDAFRRLYALHFPIHHMTFAEVYGPAKGRPADGDLTGSFECRQAVPSPCTGGKGTGTWSNHAYGMAVDVNPVENPYVGCGMSRDPTAQKFRNRSTHRRGMVTPRAVQAFRSSGWGWGGAWTGDTKDYMHFSFNGH
jgi:hypothetical protein